MALAELAFVSLAEAQSASESERALPVVRVLLAGDPARVAQLSEALLDPFRRARIELRFAHESRIEPARLLEPAAMDDVAAAALAFDVSRSDRAILYLTDRSRSRIFVRRFELGGSLDEVELERLVIAARTSVSAILAGESIGVARKEYERSLEPEAAASTSAPLRPAPREHRSLSIASRYEAQWLAGVTPSHGPGLMLLWNSGRLALSAKVGGRLPWRFTQGDLGVRLLTFNAVLGAELRHVLTRGWVASGSFGLGLDATLVQPLVLRAGVARAAEEGFRADPFNRAELGLSHFWPGVWLGAFAALDFQWIRARYTIDRDGARETLLTPHVLRPLLALGLGTVW